MREEELNRWALNCGRCLTLVLNISCLPNPVLKGFCCLIYADKWNRYSHISPLFFDLSEKYTFRKSYRSYKLVRSEKTKVWRSDRSAEIWSPHLALSPFSTLGQDRNPAKFKWSCSQSNKVMALTAGHAESIWGTHVSSCICLSKGWSVFFIYHESQKGL